jgi:hypothetical protein
LIAGPAHWFVGFFLFLQDDSFRFWPTRYYDTWQFGVDCGGNDRLNFGLERFWIGIRNLDPQCLRDIAPVLFLLRSGCGLGPFRLFLFRVEGFDDITG